MMADPPLRRPQDVHTFERHQGAALRPFMVSPADDGEQQPCRTCLQQK